MPAKPAPTTMTLMPESGSRGKSVMVSRWKLRTGRGCRYPLRRHTVAHPSVSLMALEMQSVIGTLGQWGNCRQPQAVCTPLFGSSSFNCTSLSLPRLTVDFIFWEAPLVNLGPEMVRSRYWDTQSYSLAFPVSVHYLALASIPLFAQGYQSKVKWVTWGYGFPLFSSPSRHIDLSRDS
jgi:hypothetical protein